MEKLNILYICHTSNLGGAALSLYNMIHSMRDNIVPIVLLPQKGPAYELFTENNIRCIVHHFRMNIREKSNVKHIVKFLPHYLRDKYFNLRCVNSVISELNGIKIDIVHSNASVFTIGVDLSKKLSAKHVWHIREFQDLDFNFQPFTGWKRLKKMIYASDAVIAITKSVYNHWELNKARNAYYIWDAVRSVSDICLNTNKQKYFFFSSALLCEAKGASFAIKAFGLSNLASKGYKLIMAGNVTDNYKLELSRLINEYKLKDNVNFVGYCKNIKQYMSSATAFLMCSENEGLGRVTVEAMFYGCPVIARNTGGTVEFIKDGENGFLFSDINSCVEVMKLVTSTDVLNMLNNAQRCAIENFSEEKYGDKIIKIYKEMTNFDLIC